MVKEKRPSAQKRLIREVGFSAFVIGLSVFVCEAVIMAMISASPLEVTWSFAFLDAALLCIFLTPVLFLFLYKPLSEKIQKQELAEKALIESQERLSTVFLTSPDSITVSRIEDGLITEVNRGFTELTGYSAAEAIGSSSLLLHLWNDVAERDKMVAVLRKDGKIDNFETEFVRKDGTIVNGLVSAKIIILDGQEHMLSVARDISEWKKAQRKIVASNQFLSLAHYHTRLNSLLNDYAKELRNLVACSALGLRIWDENRNPVCQMQMGFSPELFESHPVKSNGSTGCLCMDTLLSQADRPPQFSTPGGSLRIDSTTRFRASLSEDQSDKLCEVCNNAYGSVALTPIRSGNKCLGVISAADPRENKFSADIMEIVEGAALQLGTAVERTLADLALKKSNEQLEQRVTQRTAELVVANEQLQLEIEERRQIAEQLEAHQKRLSALASELALTEERERREIATELHDRIGQNLSISKIKLDELRQAVRAKNIVRMVDKVRKLIAQAIQDTRSLTFELSPPVLYMLGLEAALAWLVNETEQKHDLRIVFQDDNQPKPLDDVGRVILFQATRELLFNVVKHAQARNAQVSIRKDQNNAIRIDVEDDGVGFEKTKLASAESSWNGFGLFSIRERLKPLGGRIEIESEPGKGTRVAIILPPSEGQRV